MTGDMATDSNDPHDLERFVRAQTGVYEQALSELRAGNKRSHWMWFIFPQFAGLGSSSTAQYYAIGSRAEAEAYLRHPLLGARLRECANAVVKVTGRSASEIFGYPDDLKLRSSMTLFAEVADDVSPSDAAGSNPFRQVLVHYYRGEPDPRTLSLMGSRGGGFR